MNMDRFKNPWFWLGIISVIFTAMGIHPEMLTNWAIVKENFMNFIGNPYMLGSVVVAVIGVFTDPTTKGIGDNK